MARPREFDTEAVLLAASDLFWRHGYRGTSLDELSRITNVKKPSLYAAFGDKSQLFLTVLGRYQAMVLAANQQLLQAEGPVREVVGHWLTAFLPFCSEVGGEKGCLSVNTSLEASELVPEVRASIDAYQNEVLQLLQDALTRAQTRGELPAQADCRAMARALLALQSGFMVMATGRPSAPETLAAMTQSLDAWLSRPPP
jgi:AcrR family transcriptional regulator